MNKNLYAVIGIVVIALLLGGVWYAKNRGAETPAAADQQATSQSNPATPGSSSGNTAPDPYGKLP